MKLRAILFAAAALMGFAAANSRTVNTLLINRTDGKTDRMAMHTAMEIRTGDNNEILLVHPEITASYPLTDIKGLAFGYYNFSTGKYYSGDYELTEGGNDDSAIDLPEANGVNITLGNGRIEISGFEGTATLRAINGTTVLSATAPAQAPAVIPTASLTPGIYILNAGKTSVKILLR